MKKHFSTASSALRFCTTVFRPICPSLFLSICLSIVLSSLFASCTGSYTDPSYADYIGGGAIVGTGNGGYSRTIAQMDTERNNPYLSVVEKDMILELNKLRTNPVKWCYEVGLPMLDGRTPEQEFLLDSANRGYTRVYPLPLLTAKKGLWLAAFDNNHNSQINGGAGHTEWTGRIHGRYGTVSGGIGENAGPAGIGAQASGGATEGARIVNEMVRDRGVASKGHRKICMDASWKVVGVSYAAGYVTFDFATSFTDYASVNECVIAFAAIATGSGGASTAIRLNFSKPVNLAAGDISFGGASTTASATISGTPSSNADSTVWTVPITVSVSGNVGILVSQTGKKIRPWERVISVTAPA